MGEQQRGGERRSRRGAALATHRLPARRGLSHHSSRSMRSPCGWRPTKPSGRPAGGPPTARRDPAANRTNRRATEPADNLNGPRCPPPWCPLQPPARQGGAVPPRWGIRSRAVADSGHGVGTAGATLRGGLRTLSAGRGAAAGRRNIRQQAETVLWQARQTAVALGAAPLRRESSCSPSAAASAWKNRLTKPRSHRRPQRPPRSASPT